MHQYAITATNVALVAATAKCVAAVETPATRRVVITGFAISFEGVSAADAPVLVELVRITAGGGTKTTTTPVARRESDPAALCSGFTAYTVEPTVGNVLERRLVTPNGGLFEILYPLGDEPGAAISSGLALRCTSPAAVEATVTILTQE